MMSYNNIHFHLPAMYDFFDLIKNSKLIANMVTTYSYEQSENS